MNIKKFSNKVLALAVVGIAMLVGAVGGTTILSTVQANAQTANTQTAAVTPTVTNPSPDKSVTGGTFKSNEDSAHEAKESPEREAQENAGQFPTVK